MVTMSGFIDKMFASRLTWLIGEKLDNGRWEYIYKGYRKKYEISPKFRFNGTDIYFIDDGRIILGDNSYIGHGSHVQSSKGYEVRIGKNCAISYYVMMYTQNRVTDQDFRKSTTSHCGNIRIGDSCWVGVHTYINQGVNIGDDAVIGANSVVTRDIPAHCVAVGSPARVIKFKSFLAKEDKNELAKKYWSSLSEGLKQSLKG
jgi:maltose O-acetyltransferase